MNKKELIRALEEKWGTKATYLGAPSFAYEIKTEAQIYTIDRHGVVRGLQGDELHTEELLSEPQSEPVCEAALAKPAELHIDGYAVEVPLNGHTGTSLRNLVNMLASKQHLIGAAFGLTQIFMDKGFAEEISQRHIDSIESFWTAWSELGRDRCPGFELDIEQRTVVLKLLKENPKPEETTAFRDLTVCMTENAKKLKNCSFKPAQEENPKYALRTWLIRLGMNGDEFKTTRKVLLAHLAGSSAFRSPKYENSLPTCTGKGS